MAVAFRGDSLRVRSVRYRRLFIDRKRKVWHVLLVASLLSVIIGMFLGSTAVALLSGGILLLLLQFYLWGQLYLNKLPAGGSIDKDPLQLDQVAEADLLLCIATDQSPKDLWGKLRQQWQVNFITNRLLLDQDVIEELLSSSQSDMDAIWVHSAAISRQLGYNSLSAGAVIAALILSVEGSGQWLRQNKLTPEDVVSAAYWQIRTDKIMNKLQQKRSFGGVARDWAAGYTPLINRFGHNISMDVEHGAYQHLYLQTHTETLEQMLQSLSQPTNNTVALIGGTGAGKTSLAYALAERLLDPRNHKLSYYKVFSLQASLIVSEANRAGNLESLLLHIVAEARRAGNIILFFDDAHSFFSEDAGAADMTNVLLQVMRGSRVRMLFAFRPQDWQYLDSVANDVTASTNQLVVQEPDQSTVERVLQDQSLALEAETKATISYLAIREAYRLADRYVTDQAFPGKAISLLRTAAGNANGGWVTRESLQQSVEAMLGVKLTSAAPEESDVLLHLEENLHQYMINQEYAVGVVADALRRARAGVRNQERPVGSFLFLGPTGVGKTELCKALARVYYGGVDHIIRVDMSEYSQPDSANRLLTSSANAGSMLGQVRSNPFSVVLLDEVEKSSPEVQNLLLQMLDEGNLTDTDGRGVSFKDAIVITTSNAGADIIRQNIDNGKNLEDFSDTFINQLIDSHQFKPELINRFDEVVLFRPLSKVELRQVVELLLEEINTNLANEQIQAGLTEAAIDAIVEEGYDPRLGARPMRRMMQRTVENVLAKRVLSGDVQPGDSVVLDAEDLNPSGS